MPEPSQEHMPDNSHNIRAILVLLGILAGLLILTVRPFGYKMFQIGLGEHNIFAIILVFGIVAVIILILQRLGIIFGTSSNNPKI